MRKILSVFWDVSIAKGMMGLYGFLTSLFYMNEKHYLNELLSCNLKNHVQMNISGSLSINLSAFNIFLKCPGVLSQRCICKGQYEIMTVLLEGYLGI